MLKSQITISRYANMHLHSREFSFGLNIYTRKFQVFLCIMCYNVHLDKCGVYLGHLSAGCGHQSFMSAFPFELSNFHRI